MHVRSDSFSPYDFFPARLCFGTHDPETRIALSGNRNPHLAWDGAPEGTRSFAILCVDVDVPSAGDNVNQEGKRVPLDLPRVDFFHWVLCDLPASVCAIEGAHSDGITAKGKSPGASADGGVQGINDYTAWLLVTQTWAETTAGTTAPAPHGTTSAFGIPLSGVRPRCGVARSLGTFTGHDLRSAMDGHVLAKGEITGLYTTSRPWLN